MDHIRDSTTVVGPLTLSSIYDELGQRASYIVPEYDPLHVGINATTDLEKNFKTIIFAPFFEMLTGKVWPDRPRVREIRALCEKMMFAWLPLREEVMEKLNLECNERWYRSLSICDCTTLIHFFETLLPSTLFGYFTLYKKEVADSTGDADADTTYIHYLMQACVNATITQRPNLAVTLLEQLSDLMFWKSDKDKSNYWDSYLARGNAVNAEPWEAGWHAWMRKADFLQDPAAAFTAPAPLHFLQAHAVPPKEPL